MCFSQHLAVEKMLMNPSTDCQIVKPKNWEAVAVPRYGMEQYTYVPVNWLVLLLECLLLDILLYS